MCHVPQPVLCHKGILLIFTSVFPSTCQSFAALSGTLPSFQGAFGAFCCAPWCPFFQMACVHQVRAQPKSCAPKAMSSPHKSYSCVPNSSHHAVPVHVFLLFSFSSSLRLEPRPLWAFAFSGYCHVATAFVTPHAAVLVAGCAPPCAMLVCLRFSIHECPFLCWFRLELLAICPVTEAMEAGRMLQSRTPLSSVAAPRWLQSAPNFMPCCKAPSFGSSSACSFHSVMKRSRSVIFFFSS